MTTAKNSLAEPARTIPDFLLGELCAPPERAPATLAAPEGAGWKTLGMSDFARHAYALARGLRTLRVMRGTRALLLLESRPEFCVADVACAFAGAVSVPVDVTLNSEALQHVLGHAEPEVAIVSSSEKLKYFLPPFRDIASLREVVIMDNSTPPTALAGRFEFKAVAEFQRSVAALSRDQMYSELDELRRFVSPNDLATLIYTSGTTGVPKGVMLTHGNLTSNAIATLAHLPFQRGDIVLSFLPLHHIFARILSFIYLSVGCRVHFTDFNRFEADLVAIRPTFVPTVPRFLEKLHARALGIARQRFSADEFQRAVDLARTYEVGRSSSPETADGLAAARAGVLSVWRELLGGQLRFMAVGGAALDAALCNFLHAAGVNALQGYGLSETSPTISVNSIDANRAGTVGRPVPGVEVRLAPDGELLTRGPHVMRAYYREPAATNEVIVDGWFHTGDIASIDADGFIAIVDRKKHLFKLATGKYVTPRPLEERLLRCPLLTHAVVLGEGKPFCAALLFLSEPACAAEETIGSLTGIDPNCHPQLLAQLQSIVDAGNAGLPTWSQIKRFRLIAEPPTVANGLLTSSLKLRRREVISVHAAHIAALYVS